MILRAPASFAPRIAASPTPPQPNTATESPRDTPPVYIAAPSPAMTPQPISPAASGGAFGSTGTHCPAATSVSSANAPMPRAGESSVPSSSVIFCVRVAAVEAVPGTSAPARAARSARRAPRDDHEVAGRDVVDAVADLLDDAGRLVSEQEREVVVDRALAVVQVGVAHAARLHTDERFAGAGIRDDDRHELDRRFLLQRDDTADLVHRLTVATSGWRTLFGKNRGVAVEPGHDHGRGIVRRGTARLGVCIIGSPTDHGDALERIV